MFPEENGEFKKGEESLQEPVDDVRMAGGPSWELWAWLDDGYITHRKKMSNCRFQGE